MKKWLSQNKILLTGMLLGSLAGFLYWYFVGCSTGKCLIKTNPLYMCLYGGMMGALVINLFKK